MNDTAAPPPVSFWRSVLLLGEARLHQFRRPGRADRDDASGAGGEKALDLRQRFLHALNYCMVLPGPEAQQLAIYIGWLMHRTLGRHRRRRAVRAAVAVHPDRAVVDLHRLRQPAAGGGPALRHQAGGHGDRAARGLAHRLAGAEERLAVGHRRGGFRGHLCVAAALPAIVLAAAVAGYAGSRIVPRHFRRRRRAWQRRR